MLHVLRRHYPQLAPALEGVTNAFAPWKTLTGPVEPRLNRWTRGRVGAHAAVESHL